MKPLSCHANLLRFPEKQKNSIGGVKRSGRARQIARGLVGIISG